MCINQALKILSLNGFLAFMALSQCYGLSAAEGLSNDELLLDEKSFATLENRRVDVIEILRAQERSLPGQKHAGKNQAL